MNLKYSNTLSNKGEEDGFRKKRGCWKTARSCSEIGLGDDIVSDSNILDDTYGVLLFSFGFKIGRRIYSRRNYDGFMGRVNRRGSIGFACFIEELSSEK